MATSVHSSHPAFSHTDDIAATWTDFLLLAGRVLLGWSFLALGYGKLVNIPMITTSFASMGLAPAGPLAWLAGFVQVILGAALILGIATRYAGLASFVWALASIAIVQRYPASEAPAIYQSVLKNIAIMGGALYAFAIGAGRYSLDALFARR
jgi:putative oxidoreductase